MTVPFCSRPPTFLRKYIAYKQHSLYISNIRCILAAFWSYQQHFNHGYVIFVGMLLIFLSATLSATWVDPRNYCWQMDHPRWWCIWWNFIIGLKSDLDLFQSGKPYIHGFGDGFLNRFQNRPSLRVAVRAMTSMMSRSTYKYSVSDGIEERQ